MTVKERLKVFISSIKLTNQKFEVECKLSNGYIANMRKGVGGMALERISNKYPNLSKAWLLTGEGEMLKGSTERPPGIDKEERLFALIESQQETIKELSHLLSNLEAKSKKGDCCHNAPADAADAKCADAGSSKVG